MLLGSAGGSDQGVVALGVFMVGRRLKLLPVHGQGDAVPIGLNRDLVPRHRDLLGANTKEAADIHDRLCDSAALVHQQVADLTDFLPLRVHDRLADHALHGNAGWGWRRRGDGDRLPGYGGVSGGGWGCPNSGGAWTLVRRGASPRRPKPGGRAPTT